jgi:hypothetical protein
VLRGLGGVVLSGAIALALVVVSAVALSSGGGRQPPPPTPSAQPTRTPDPVALGQNLFQTKGCIGCHSVSSRGLRSEIGIGPDLSNLRHWASVRKPEMTAEAYVRESIVQPQAFLVPGFRDREIEMPVIPVSEPELQAVVVFLLTDP